MKGRKEGRGKKDNRKKERVGRGRKKVRKQ